MFTNLMACGFTSAGTGGLVSCDLQPATEFPKTLSFPMEPAPKKGSDHDNHPNRCTDKH